jgi:hypothetical protein
MRFAARQEDARKGRHARLGVLEHSASDGVPVVVQDVADLIYRRLVNHNRSVSAVVLLWRERVTGIDSNTPPNVSLMLICRSIVIRHRKPHASLPAKDDVVLVQGTYALKVNANNAKPKQADRKQ